MTLIPDTKDTTPQTLQNGYLAGKPAVNLKTLRSTVNANQLTLNSCAWLPTVKSESQKTNPRNRMSYQQRRQYLATTHEAQSAQNKSTRGVE